MSTTSGHRSRSSARRVRARMRTRPIGAHRRHQRRSTARSAATRVVAGDRRGTTRRPAPTHGSHERCAGVSVSNPACASWSGSRDDSRDARARTPSSAAARTTTRCRRRPTPSSEPDDRRRPRQPALRQQGGHVVPGPLEALRGAAGSRRRGRARPSRLTKRSAVSMTSPSTRPGTATISRTRRTPSRSIADVDDEVDAAATVGTTNRLDDVLAGQQRQGAHLDRPPRGRCWRGRCTCRAGRC